MLGRRRERPEREELRARRARSGRRPAARRSTAAGTQRNRAPRGVARARGKAAAIAASVALRAGAAAAKRPSASSSSSGGDPVRRHQLDDAERGRGQRPGLVDADRVHGGERLDRVQLLRERPEPGHAEGGRGVGDRDEQDQALGDERHHSGDGRVDRVSEGHVLLLERDDQHRPERDHHGEEYVEEPVDRPLERRARMAELAGRPRDPPRVAVRPDRGDLERSGALEHERARPHLLARRPLDGARLAGQDRLVEPEPGRVDERAVGDDLIARREPHEVAHDEVRDVHRPRLPVAHDGRARGDERREPVELLAGAELLPDPDPGVRDEDPEEERVTPVPEDERQNPEREQDRVERRDRVGADDRGRGAACRRLRGGAARRPACRRLRLGQALAHRARRRSRSDKRVTRAARPCRCPAPASRSPSGARPSPPRSRAARRAGAAAPAPSSRREAPA